MQVETGVSGIIPNLNGEKFIGQCLESTLSSGVAEVIVVDDGSTDNSISEIRRFPVSLIQNQTNLGPTKARNIGAQRAEGRLFLFLDSDMKLNKEYLEGLSRLLDTIKNAGAVSGQIVNQGSVERMAGNFGYDGGLMRGGLARVMDRIGSKLGNNPRALSILARIAEPVTLRYSKDRLRKVDWVVERAFMTPADVFRRVGGFDERYFMFMEGPSLCLDIRNQGLDVWYTPEVRAEHLDLRSHPDSRSEIFKASQRLYYQKHKSTLESRAFNVVQRVMYR